MDLVPYCPPALVEMIRSADLTSSSNSALFSRVAGAGSLDCQTAAVEAIARRLDRDSDPAVVGDFATAVATYARFLEPETREAVRAAYLRMPYSPAIAPAYFTGLRRSGIDIREALATRLREDWSFADPAQNAATWHQYLYLASLDTPGALDRLAQKIAETPSGNDVTNLLQSLNELPGPKVTAVIAQYVDDQRRADGVSGPGARVGTFARLLLSFRAAAAGQPAPQP